MRLLCIATILFVAAQPAYARVTSITDLCTAVVGIFWGGPKESPSTYYLPTRRLGEGAGGSVWAARLPPDWRVPGAPVGWQPGTTVAVKQAGKKLVQQKAILNEAEALEKIAPNDRNGLFVRGVYDETHEVLLTEYAEGMIPLETFLQSGKVPRAALEPVKRQLDEALGVLRASNLVHSDLNPNNILIDPGSFRIRILDPGIATPPGTFAPQLAIYGREGKPFRGGREGFTSPEQTANKPATFADDAFTVEAVNAALRAAAARR